MYSTETIAAILFANDKLIKAGQNVSILPDLFGGITLSTASGEVIASSRGEFMGSETFVDGSGNTIASVSTNVQGGTQVDLGSGEFINGIPNIYGGENFFGFGEMIGYSAPAFDGGVNLFTSTGSSITSISPTAFDSMSITTPITVHLPNDFSESFSFSTQLDPIADASHLTDFADVFDGVSGAAGFSDMLEFF